MSEEGQKHEVKAAAYFVVAGTVVLAMWGWYLLEQFTDWRITSMGSTASEEPIPIYFALIATVLAPAVAALLWRRAVGIAANGMEAKATVLSVGGRVQSMRSVQFEYTHEGAPYKKKMSLSCAVADKLQPGDELDIIVDQRKPTRVLVK